MDFEPLLIDGRWRLTRSYGRRPGNIFDARDEKTGETVVVEIFGTAWVPSHAIDERRVGALVGHPAFMTIREVGTCATNGCGYVVMDRVAGEPLTDLLQRGPADVVEAVTIACEVLAGLAAAHEKGVVLGWIHEGDVVVEPRAGGLRVRIVAPLGRARTRMTPLAECDASTPPEQVGALGVAPSVATDLYEVGVLLYRMLTGRPPFGDDAPHSSPSVSSEILHSKPAPVRSELGVPLALQQVIWRALEKRPEDRFRSAREFLDALTRAL